MALICPECPKGFPHWRRFVSKMPKVQSVAGNSAGMFVGIALYLRGLIPIT
jgi:hypothetical protein